MAAAAALAAVTINVQPFDVGGATFVLAGLRLSVAAWFLVGFAYVGGHWRATSARMDFVRLTGEWLIYYGLIAIGGGLLVALTFGVFSAVDVNAEPFVTTVVIPGGAAGATVVAAWLVESKQAVIENIAPVLTTLFAPLFTVLLVAVLFAGGIQADLVGDARDLLILGDVVLLAAVSIVLYAWSARSPTTRPGWTDRLHVLLIAAAVLVDLVVLGALALRTSEYGWSPNKAASLGLNVILLVNLLGAGWLSSRFIVGKARFHRLIEWQTAFVPVIVGWARVVVLTFGVAFDFS